MRIPVPTLIAVLSLFASSTLANSAPVVSNVTVSQRTDGSKKVDIRYNLSDADGDKCTVWAVISNDGGETWTVPAMTFTGNCGQGVTPGTGKHIIWDAGRDIPGKLGTYKARVYADDGQGPSEMVYVPAGWFKYQNSIGLSEYCASFMIDRYEVTNHQYCEFLNAADPTSLYYSTSMEITRFGSSGSYTYTVQSGREQYPIRYVSALDAQAFAAWKSATYGGTYRLPTEQEWEKAAGWDPALQKLWTYGYQQDVISSLWCNYNNAYGGPLAVGSFNGTGGKNLAKSYYGCFDMSGNLWEWTSSMYDGSNRVIRGGNWNGFEPVCAVSFRGSYSPSVRYVNVGFRLAMSQ